MPALHDENAWQVVLIILGALRVKITARYDGQLLLQASTRSRCLASWIVDRLRGSLYEKLFVYSFYCSLKIQGAEFSLCCLFMYISLYMGEITELNPFQYVCPL